MDAPRLYAQLQDACRSLEAAEEFAAAAHVAHAMALVRHRLGVGEDDGGEED